MRERGPLTSSTWNDSVLASDIQFLAIRAFAAGARNLKRRLEPLGLSVRSYSMLMMACEQPAPTQRDLAEFLTLDPSRVVAIVDDLERSGAVRRETDSVDRRRNVIRATPAGRQLADQALAAVQVTEAESLAPLAEEERALLRRLLRAIALDV